mmetsp:Transcript_11287/g.27990  ORF Transcript_11287/g.27990 Transcript_11287/m.27990 type:complete len:157 (+) Transcript_11287:1663-2133(+)
MECTQLPSPPRSPSVLTASIRTPALPRWLCRFRPLTPFCLCAATPGNYSAVILPEAGRPFEAKLGNVLCKLDGNTQRFSIAGFVCWIFKSPMISQGHFQGDGTRVFKQHFFGTSPDTVDPDPDLRRFMDEDHEDKGYFFMPFSTDDLSSQQWQGMR